NTYNNILGDPTTNNTYYIDVQSLPGGWATNMYDNFTNIIETTDSGYTTNTSLSVPLIIGPDGFFGRPANWTSQRGSPGQIQAAISTLVGALHALRQSAVNENYDKTVLDKDIEVFKSQILYAESNTTSLSVSNLVLQNQINDINLGYNISSAW